MNPISQYKFYELGSRLHRVIAQKTSVNAAEMFVPLMDAQASLDNLLKGDPITLDHAKNDGNALLGKLGAIFNKHFIDPNTRQFRFPGRDDMIDAHELTLLTSLVEKFETSLAAELSRRAIYAVPKRGLFDSYDLAEHADTQFSDEVLARMPAGMRDDIRAAGRAVAFGLGVAACFHLIRALESAFTMYLEAYTGQSASSFNDPWKDGLARLKGGDKGGHGDQRIVTLLQEVDGRYRTALAKNDTSITLNEVVIFFGMASSLLTLMMEALSSKKQVEPRYRKLQEKVEQVITENGIDDDEETDNGIGFTEGKRKGA
jgi:hypothetical protein